MNEESIKNHKNFGLFINQELVQENTYQELIEWVARFELNVRLQYGQENVESLVNELEDDTVNKLLRIETENEVIFYDIRLLEKIVAER